MKKLLPIALMLVAGCSNNSGMNCDQNMRCGLAPHSMTYTVPSTARVVSIQDFKFNATADQRHIKYSFFVVNESNTKMTYNGLVAVVGRGYRTVIPITGTLQVGEKKEISNDVDMGKIVYEADVHVTVEGAQTL